VSCLRIKLEKLALIKEKAMTYLSRWDACSAEPLQLGSQGGSGL